jgi:hypothetical protein
MIERLMSMENKAAADYCVAIGIGVVIDEPSYGEIQIATPKSKVRFLVDGTVEVNGTSAVDKDRTIYQCFRSLLGLLVGCPELPELPHRSDIGDLFLSDEAGTAYGKCCVLIGPGAKATGDHEIVIRNNLGYELRISEDTVMQPNLILAEFRALFNLPAQPTA